MTASAVVTGASAVTALGRDLPATRAALEAGRSAVAEVPAEGLPSARPHRSPAARIVTFSTEPELPRSKARRLDRASQYAVVAARQALADAAYEMAGREERTGILLGTGSAGAGPLVDFERQMALEGPEAASPFLFPYTVANAPASQVSIELKLFGPNVTITQKDPSALNALLYSCLALASRRARAMLAGGVDEWNPVYAMGFDRVGALKGEKRASGIIQGEGGFAVLLESEQSARRRGAQPSLAADQSRRHRPARQRAANCRNDRSWRSHAGLACFRDGRVAGGGGRTRG